ncbi:beta-1,4-glucuronyltransferase 1-like [Oppia nitens]|uniref:beta-1,4-glucuronyltransferase 1-like n=1 Tax=Oppia nitens TaxID=1686743 RepID=UPI0023DC89CD|nr:beta-1,4-glucuronyltransferase 1-like [Oppia nitens]
MSKSRSNHSYTPLVSTPRFDSRLLLRALIAFNIVLAVYNIITLQSTTTSSKSNPCLIVINTSKQTATNHKNESDESVVNHNINPTDNKESKQIEGIIQDNSDSLLDKQSLSSNTIEEQLVDSNVDKEVAIWWSTETRGSYTVLKNYIPSSETPDRMRNVTLTTQGTYSFLYHLENLCIRWDGFISVGVYAPGLDFPLAVNLIYYLRKCGHQCVSAKTTWHMVYDSLHSPHSNTSLPSSYVEDMNFDCLQSFDNIVSKFNTTFRSDHSLPYPINVVRNVARLNSQTKYIFASDIELYPSVDIVSGFMRLHDRISSGLVPNINLTHPLVYVIPIFEVKANIEPPMNKSQLKTLIKSGNAIFFHKWVCDACQNFPDRDKWIDVISENNSLNIFRVTRRTRTRNYWEPLYIGTNDEPLYDERLTWDGKRDKMSQMYEMCLRGYDLGILDNAFLVHAPGIKHIDPKEEKKRLPFIKRNNMIYNTILAKLRRKYGTKNQC